MKIRKASLGFGFNVHWSNYKSALAFSLVKRFRFPIFKCGPNHHFYAFGPVIICHAFNMWQNG